MVGLNSRMEQTEGGKISELERYNTRHYSVLMQRKQTRRKKWTQLQGPIKLKLKISNIHVIRNPEGEKKYNRAERVLEEIMAENYPNLTTDINLQVQKTEQTPYRINSKKLTLRHIIIKLLKTKTKKNLETTLYLYEKNINDCRILIRTRGKWYIFISERRGLWTQNPISSKNMLQKWRKNQDTLRWRKTKKMCCQQTCS